MNALIGTFYCPKCLSSRWKVQDWTTYMAVVCAQCGHKLGELFRKEEDTWDGSDPSSGSPRTTR